MNQAIAANFVPPTPEQVAEFLQRHPLRGPSPMQAWAPFLGFGLVLILAVVFDHGPALFLPWLLLAAIFIYSGSMSAQVRRLRHKTVQAQELAMLRRYPQSLRLAWRTLPSVTRMPELYLRLCVLMASNLGQMRLHEAALVILDDLIERLPADHPGAIQIRLQRAVAELALDHLLDADRSLRFLRDKIHTPGAEPAPSLYRFALLYQAIRTLRDEDAVQASENLLDDLRPLGIDAGYGYALAALGHYRLAQRRPQQAPGLLEQAQVWWSRATILLPVAALVNRLPELRETSSDPRMQQARQSALPPVG